MTFVAVGVHYDPRCKLKKKTDHQRLGPTAYLVDRKQVHGPGVCSQKWRFILNYSPHKWASRWVRCMFKQQITPTPGIEGITHLLSWLKIISFQLAKLPQTSSYANKWDPIKILPLNQNPLEVEVCSTGWGRFVLLNFPLYPKRACSRAKRCRERQGNHHFFIDDLSSYSFPSPTGFPRVDPQSLCVSVMLFLLRWYRITHRAVMAFCHPKAESLSSHFLQQSLWQEDRWSCKRNPDSAAQISMDPPLLHCSQAESSGPRPQLPLL